MAHSSVRSFVLDAGELREIRIEVVIRPGLPYFELLGGADRVLRESRGRVRAAIESAGFKYPRSHIIVSLTPADQFKSGSTYDLAIALAILQASRQIPSELEFSALGELDLRAKVLDTVEEEMRRRVLDSIQAGRWTCNEFFLLPLGNEASTLDHCFELSGLEEIKHFAEIWTTEDREAFHLWLRRRRQQFQKQLKPEALVEALEGELAQNQGPELELVFSQESALWALAMAIAGRHPCVFLGSPGCGKSHISRASRRFFLKLLIRSWKEYGEDLWDLRGDRSHPYLEVSPSLTRAQFLGGPRQGRGAIELARGGILYFEELLHFRLDILRDLRQILDAVQGLGAAEKELVQAADFLFLASANPCPCGQLFENRCLCHCNDGDIERYWKRFSNALIDRISLWPELRQVPSSDYASGLSYSNEDLESLSTAILKARIMQIDRYRRGEASSPFNACLDASSLGNEAIIAHEIQELAASMADVFHLSVRSYQNLLRLTRSLADLHGHEEICEADLLEAAAYRLKLGEVSA
ncbi:MAG: ATP-binding protein [Eubacteriales bacterium]|nr:ATP-binding protein [Eubacteriales bacterium]